MPIDPVTGTFIAGAVGGLIDGIFGLFGSSNQNKANMRLAQYQNQWNLEQWHRQNEYNAPSATIKRLVDAGVNPRAYNNIGQFANAERPAPAAEMSYTSPLSAFQGSVRSALENALMYQEVRKKKAEVDNTESQIDYRVAQKELATADKELKEASAREKGSSASLNEEKEMLTMFQSLVFCAENGINPDDFGYGPVDMYEDNGRIFQGNSVFSRQKLFKLLESYSERLDYKMTSDKFLSQLRKFEALTKEDRYKVLQKFGLDTDSSDTILSLARWFLRLIDRLP